MRTCPKEHKTARSHGWKWVCGQFERPYRVISGQERRLEPMWKVTPGVIEK